MRLWTTKDIAHYLGITERYASDLCKTGAVKAIKVGRFWRTNKRMVDASFGIEDERSWRSDGK